MPITISGATISGGVAFQDAGGGGGGTQKAIFGYGAGPTAITNLVSNAGVVATDTAGVGTARYYLAAAGYGTDKAIFGYGWSSGGGFTSITNLVSNAGVVATDTAGVGTARRLLAAAGYGTDKAIFGYGTTTTNIAGQRVTTDVPAVVSGKSRPWFSLVRLC